MPDIVGRAIIKVESVLDSQSLNKVGSGFQKALVPAIGALGALGVAAVKSIHNASDLNEQVSKSEVIFGKQTEAIRKFADTASTSLGLSSRAALEATSNFGIVAQGAGLSGKAAADFSKQFTTLAGDLASFSNTSTDEAITAIGAALRGESEPIRKYGVLLDDATLRAKALKLGLISTVKDALTPQQKALAASQVILDQTGKAQGDFARTSASAANQGRILAAQTENLSAKLGTRLLPYYVKLQTVALAALDWMSKHTTAVAILAGGIAALALAVVSVNIAMALLAANPVALTIAAIVVGVAALAAGLIYVYKHSETLRNAITTGWQAIKDAYDKYLAPALDALKKAWDKAKVPIEKLMGDLREIGDNLLPYVQPLLKKFADYMGKKFSSDLGTAAAVLGAVAGAIGFIADALDKYYKIAQKVGKLAGSGLALLLNAIGGDGGVLGGGVTPRASGGPASGLTLVGERGPELLDLPGGSYVHSNRDSRKMLSASGASGNFTYAPIFNGPTTGSDMLSDMEWSARFYSRQRVGSR